MSIKGSSPKATEQASFDLDADRVEDISEAFSKVYYHLYSNSDSSRAEKIFEDLSKLLLVKALADSGENGDLLSAFESGHAGSQDGLLRKLSEVFPDFISPSDRFYINDKSLRQALTTLSPYRLSSNNATVLGDAFQSLIGPRLRGDKGQFFTPRSVVKAMVEIAAPKAGDVIVDPAAGTGGFLAEAFAYLEKSCSLSRDTRLVGVEKDADLHRLGGAMLQITTKGQGSYLQGNSLEIGGDIYTKHLPFGSADIVLTNPPFGSKIAITDKRILSMFALGHAWTRTNTGSWQQQSVIAASQDPQILFLELCLRMLKEGGLCGIVLPEGVFGNSSTGYVWDFVRSLGVIEAMIDCPRTTFQPGTDTKTNIVFIRRLICDEVRQRNTRVAVAKHCGHDRRGKTRKADGSAIRDDFGLLAASFRAESSVDWVDCQVANSSYLVPRYLYGKERNGVNYLERIWGTRTVSLGSMVQSGSVVVRKGHEVGAESYGSGEVPFIRTSDIHNWEVSVDPTNGVSDAVYEQYRLAQDLRKGDILMVVDGRYKIGRTAILHAENTKAVVQSHIRVISVREGCPFTPFELLYVLNLPEVLEQIRDLVFVQSTLGSVGKRLEELLLPLPPNNSTWRSQVATFEKALIARASALTKLHSFETPEPEL